jgi:hypothetical protein
MTARTATTLLGSAMRSGPRRIAPGLGLRRGVATSSKSGLSSTGGNRALLVLGALALPVSCFHRSNLDIAADE